MSAENIAPELKTQGQLALDALQKHCEQKKKKVLFPESEASVFVLVKYKKIPLARGSSLRKFIIVPRPDRNPTNTSICLILPDLDRSPAAARDPDVERQSREWAELLREKYGLTAQHISKIFTVTQLKREYSQHADRARLANTYDIFMVDQRLMRKVFYLLGSNFRKPAKMPLPIDSSRDIAKKLQEAYSIVQLSIAPLTDVVSVRIGNLGQSLSDLCANFGVIVDSVLAHCLGGPANIRSCYVQTAGTEVSLPIFVDFGSPNEVDLELPKIPSYAYEMDECTTLPDGLAVKVRADGEVTVVDAKTGDEVLYPTMQDEWENSDDIKPLTGVVLERVLRRKAKELTQKGDLAEELGKAEKEEKSGDVEEEERPKEERKKMEKGKKRSAAEEGKEVGKRKRKLET